MANAEAIVVAGDATVEQMNALINVSEYSNIESYTLNDTVENLLAGGDIVANAASATVAGEPVLTVAQYNEIAAVATVETYTVVDTAEAILEAGADAAALANAGSVAITDEAVTLEQAVALDALSLDVAYPAVDVSLEAAAAADTLPANYALTADVFAAGEVTVEAATAAFGAVSAIVEGAANAEELAVADLFTWSVADTLENIEAADAAVIEGADAYTLTNEAGDLGELTGEQYELVLGAANADDYTYTVVPSPITGISAQGPVVEGNDIAFTVEMDYAVNVERVISYQIEGATTGTAGAADALADLGQITGTVTIPAGETTGTITLTPLEDGTTEGREAFTVSLLNDDGTEVVATSNVVVVEDNANAGQNTTLTTGVEELTGGAGNDTYIGMVNTTANSTDSTFNALDSLDGLGGDDTFRLNVQGNVAFDSIDGEVSNIENLVLRSTADIDGLDLTNIAGLELLQVTRATGAGLDVDLATTTDAEVSGATGTIDLDGGQNIVVNDDAAGQAITIGANTVNNGTIDVTDTDQGAAAIAIDGGTDVTVDATTEDASSGNITVGQGGAATDLPSGAVSVTQNVSSDATGAVTAGDVTVGGGSTIDITANLETTAEAGANTVITAGTYNADAGDSTTSINITQNVTANDFAKNVTTPATTETAVVTFGALAAGESVSISAGANSADNSDLAFIATEAMTAEEVAAAFANLSNEDTQAAGGTVENGYFIGDLDAGWVSGAASGNKVTFSATTVGAKANDITVETDANGDYSSADDAAADADFSVAVTDGVNEVAQVAQDITGVYGNVTVDDNATASVTNVTLDGFAGAAIGTNASMDALTDLSLRKSAGTTTLTTAQTSLNLTLDAMTAGSAVNLDAGGASIATLNLTATGEASDVDFTAAAVTAVNITADADLDVTGGTFVAATDIDVTGAGDVALGDVSAAATDITASTATGDISATVDNSTNVATGAGADTITIEAAATNNIDGTVDLGAGNDTLVLDGDDNTVPTGTVNGGEGTDTVSMTSANAQAYDNNTNFASAISGFERLLISDAVDVDGGVTIDTEALGFADYVTLSGTYDGTDTGADGTDDEDTLTLANLANAATVVLSASQTESTHVAGMTAAVVADVKDAATNSADSLNVVLDTLDGTGDLDAGTLTANNVESINVTVNDVDNATQTAPDAYSMTLDADSVTSITVGTDPETVTNADGDVLQDLTSFDLTVSNASALETVDASAMIGNFSYTADDGVTTVTGGAGDDELIASGSEDTLIGGAGDDTLTGAKLTAMTGGEGNDTFKVVTGALATEFSYITDFQAGDVIDMTDGNEFVAGKFTQIGATLADYVDAAVNNTSATQTSWFNLTVDGTDYTYIVDNQSGGASFDEAQDSIIALVGTFDLSQANYNQTNGTLEIA